MTTRLLLLLLTQMLNMLFFFYWSGPYPILWYTSHIETQFNTNYKICFPESFVFLEQWCTNTDCSWGEWQKIIVPEFKFNLGLLLGESTKPAKSGKKAIEFQNLASVTASSRVREIVFKYWQLLRGMVENYCPRGEIQPLPTIHRGL